MDIVNFIQTIGIIATLMIAIWQIRVTNKNLKSDVNNIISERFFEINKLLFENPDVFPALEKPYPTETPLKGDRRYHLVHILLDLCSQIYAQRHHYGYLEEKKWESHVKTMNVIINKPYVDAHWNKQKHQFDNDFVSFVEKLKTDIKQA